MMMNPNFYNILVFLILALAVISASALPPPTVSSPSHQAPPGNYSSVLYSTLGNNQSPPLPFKDRTPGSGLPSTNDPINPPVTVPGNGHHPPPWNGAATRRA
ncbi:uncharacterized protein DNG_09127 [Cephalotrichum gorgonifer]|uniref:Transmembrane protein n=1 Tax=Cephalotrichum gorgonifer TaxID=2041049 RepID=A0AAE8SZV4_9PEZI|nr:uncharacterized protein DNG_09127 [Cephalotrichum gorgonifer]